MEKHWEYNQYNMPNQPQACGANMQWIWQVGMSFITFGNQQDKWQLDESQIRKACEAFYFIPIDVKSRYFYQYLDGGLTQGPISFNLV